MQTRDYIERLIEQVAAAVARVAGFVAEGRVDEADEALDDVWSSVIGLRRGDAGRLDGGTLRALLGAKASVAARLLEAEATVEDARGRSARAEDLRQRAAALR
jgi:hypothetical protein